MFVPVFGNFPEGQLVGHVVPSKYLPPEQLKHSELFGPLQVVHSASQESQVLVVEFS